MEPIQLQLDGVFRWLTNLEVVSYDLRLACQGSAAILGIPPRESTTNKTYLLLHAPFLFVYSCIIRCFHIPHTAIPPSLSQPC